MNISMGTMLNRQENHRCRYTVYMQTLHCKECLSPCRRYLGKQGRSVAHFGVRLETLSLLQNKLDLAVKCYLGAVLVKMTIAKERH